MNRTAPGTDREGRRVARPDAVARSPSLDREVVPVLLNPRAHRLRRGGAKRQAEDLRRAFETNGIRARIQTVLPAHLDLAIRKALERGASTLVVGGGDGTVRTAAQALAGSETVLGILPLGRLNHGADALGIPPDVEGAVKVLATGEVRVMDLGDLDGHAFVNNSALGLYPHLVQMRDAGHARRGLLEWVRAGWLTFRRFPLLDVRVDRPEEVGTLRTPLVFVGNNEYVFGARIGERRTLQGGRLFLCAVRSTGRFRFLRACLRSLVLQYPRDEDLVCLLTHEVSIELGRGTAWATLDGELVRVRGRLRFRVRPQALRVLAPRAVTAPR